MREAHSLAVASLENKFLQIMSAVNDTFIKENKNLCCYVLYNLFLILIQYKNYTQNTPCLFCLQFQWRIGNPSSNIVIADTSLPILDCNPDPCCPVPLEEVGYQSFRVEHFSWLLSRDSKKNPISLNSLLLNCHIIFSITQTRWSSILGKMYFNFFPSHNQ